MPTRVDPIIRIRIHDELLQLCKAAAESEGRSLNDWAIHVVRASLRRSKPPPAVWPVSEGTFIGLRIDSTVVSELDERRGSRPRVDWIRAAMGHSVGWTRNAG